MTVIRMLPRFRKAYASLSTYAARERWSRDAIEQLQLDRINQLWRHAIEYVPYYRELSKARRLPPRFADLREFSTLVPLLAKETVRSKPQELRSRRAEPGQWRYTGGSTGVPTRVFRSHAAHQAMLRSRYRFYQMWDIDIFDRWAFVWGHSASFAPGWKGLKSRLAEPVKDRFRRRIRLSAYDLSRDTLRRHLDRIQTFQPAAIYSYSMAGHLLAREALENGFTCDSLKMVNLTAEPVHDYIVRSVERAFGVPAVAEYGSVECGFLAGEWPDRTLRVREDEVFLESVQRDDGVYEIVVTVLDNPSFPLLRYKIGDVTDAPIVYPDRGFAIVHDVTGRDIDFVQTKTGRHLHGLSFEHVLQECTFLRRWRVHQRADGSVSVVAESSRAVDAETKAGLANKLRELLEGYEVEIEFDNPFPSTRAGKHRAIVSDLYSSALTHQEDRALELV